MIKAWFQNSLTKVYPVNNVKGCALSLHSARKARLSFQVAVSYTDAPKKQEVVSASLAIKPIAGVTFRVRRVGFVPIRHFSTLLPESERESIGHIPGYVPDPLFDETNAELFCGEAVAFWVTVDVAANCRIGNKKIAVDVLIGDKKTTSLAGKLQVYKPVLKARKKFPVFHWFYSDAILDWYKVKPFEEKYWVLLKNYLKNMAEHHQDTVFVPIFTPPLDGVKSPSQLLKVTRKGQKYTFDWRDVRRYVTMAKACGLRKFEWSHLFTQWGAQHAIRIYKGQGIDEKLLWKPETSATSPTYRNFLSQFLPAFKAFLDTEGIFKQSYFHVSDEPHSEDDLANYRKVRGLLRKLAPWMKTMDALSSLKNIDQGLTEEPIPSIKVFDMFQKAGIKCMAYFCCAPRGKFLNRHMDTPLSKIGMTGWLFYHLEVKGFLHWGYNYWQKRSSRTLIDPFTESSAGFWPAWTYGDTFVVYPGENGPIDSIRWEVFAESLQDYALLQTCGVEVTDKLFKGVNAFNDFPWSEAWIAKARKKVLARAD